MSDEYSGATQPRAAVPDGVEFLARAPASVRVAEALARASGTDVRVALYGEPGVGKTLAARCLHTLSSRADRAFARVAVRQVSAMDRLGDRTFMAGLDGGTLVLEGIDEAPGEVQALLVGVVEEWGSAEDREDAPVRLVVTGQRDLLGLVEAGSFRPDLYYLVDVFPLVVPPLRERAEEIPLFFDHFFRKHAPDQPPPGLSGPFLEQALSYDWPGNLRELENLILNCIAASPNGPLELPELLPARGCEPRVAPFSEAKRQFEGAYVRRLLALTEGNVTRAAEFAGKARKDFYALMARNGVDPTVFRSGSQG